MQHCPAMHNAHALSLHTPTVCAFQTLKGERSSPYSMHEHSWLSVSRLVSAYTPIQQHMMQLHSYFTCFSFAHPRLLTVMEHSFANLSDIHCAAFGWSIVMCTINPTQTRDILVIVGHHEYIKHLWVIPFGQYTLWWSIISLITFLLTSTLVCLAFNLDSTHL